MEMRTNTAERLDWPVVATGPRLAPEPEPQDLTACLAGPNGLGLGRQPRPGRDDRPVEPFSRIGPHFHHSPAYHAASPPGAPTGMLTCAASIAPAAGSGSRSTTHPAVGLRCSPWRSISRYNVVRSTPAMRAAFDMFPLARLTSQVRYCRSNCAITRSRAA